MRRLGFGLRIAKTAVRVEQVVAGIFTERQAMLLDNSHVSATTNNPVYSPGQYRVNTPAAACQISMTVPAMTGKIWVSARMDKDTDSTGIGWKFRGLSPTYDPLATRARGGNQVFQLPVVAGSVTLNLLCGTGQVGTLQYAQAVDMDVGLALPWDIYLAMGQSNMAAGANGLGIDPHQDDWSDARLLYMPGSTYSGHGTTIGTVDALRAPMQMNAETAGAVTAGYITQGVSPAVSFAKRILQATEAGRNVCIVAAAVNSTNLVGANGAWNPAGLSPFAYNHAVGLIAGAMAAAPAGSKIKGVIWAQGESDLDSPTLYPAAWAAMRTAFEATWTMNSWTDAPVNWIIGTSPPDSTDGRTAAMITSQSNMDALSGHADSLLRCRVVNRVNGVEADGLHATAASNRDLGRRMAERMLAGA